MMAQKQAVKHAHTRKKMAGVHTAVCLSESARARADPGAWLRHPFRCAQLCRGLTWLMQGKYLAHATGTVRMNHHGGLAAPEQTMQQRGV